jgi:serine/threonine protein kinase
MGLREKDLTPLLEAIIPGLQDALNYIHDEGFCHNDVSPKNIIVQQNGMEIRAFLVDFGCAKACDTELVGFVGTPLYAHRKIFTFYPTDPWRAQKAYDNFALGLSLSALVLKSGANWNMGRFPRSLGPQNRKDLNELARTRRSKAMKLAESTTCSKKIQKTWTSLLLEEKNPKKRNIAVSGKKGKHPKSTSF